MDGNKEKNGMKEKMRRQRRKGENHEICKQFA